MSSISKAFDAPFKVCYLLKPVPIKALKQLSSPEYRDRHLFTARLRLAIFIGFWCLYLYFYHGVLGQLQWVTLIFAASFLLTTTSYFWITRKRFVFLSVVTEVIADLITITTVIYITEGPYSDFFTIYFFYLFVAGVFYNYMLALFIAFGCFIFYGVFLFLCQYGFIPPLLIDWGDQIPTETHSPHYHFFFFAIFALLAVYGVKVSSYFSQKRERMLEARNKELTALANMSSTIRSTISIEKVLEQVLQGLQVGLDLKLSLLILFDREKKVVRCLPPKGHPIVEALFSELAPGLQKYYLPIDVVENTALQALLHHRLIFRKKLEEVLVGLTPSLSKEKLETLEKIIGFKRIVGVPLVAEEELLGALIGFYPMSYVDEQTVKSLEAFANQAALILEAALLIQRLREANERLQEANRVKSEFLATMSHELRTPLTAIIGFSELLLEGVMGELNEEQKESLQEVLNNGATLLEMINNLLDMAKVEAGKMTLELSSFDLRELLQRLAHTIHSLVQQKKQKMELLLPEKVPPMQGDERKMQQIILNLLSNAIKFTPEEGRITLSLRYHNGKNWREKVDWSARLPERERYESGVFELSVEDTGIGIQEERLPIIFEMFSQVDSSTTRNFGGTGLGLALAKQFTEMHHGVIWVESEYGKGTTFTVILPTTVVI